MGLAAKNAILVIEFAEQAEKRGARVIDAALEASPDIADTMLGYLATRAVPPAALMFSVAGYLIVAFTTHAHGVAPPCRRKHGNGITTAARSAAGNHSDAGDAGEVPAGVIRQDPARGDGWAEQEHAWQAERRSAVLST